MLKEERQKLLLSLKDTGYGKALIEELDEALQNISDITTIQTWEETLGRKFAIRTIKRIMSFLEPKENKVVNKNQFE